MLKIVLVVLALVCAILFPTQAKIVSETKKWSRKLIYFLPFPLLGFVLGLLSYMIFSK